MPGVIIPDARGGKVWIHANDGSALPRLARCDTAGHISPSGVGPFDIMYREAGSSLTPGAGDFTWSLSACPAGYQRVIRHIWSYDNTTVKRIILRVVLDAQWYILADVTQTVVGRAVIALCDVVLDAGDQAQGVIMAVTAGDDLYWGASGFDVKVP